MKYRFTPPSLQLEPFILRYYQINGFASEVEPYEEFTLPNGLTSLVFHFEEKIKVSNVAYDGENIPKFYIFGKYTRPVFVRHTFGKADVFGVIFQPAAFFYFLCIPQHELTDVLVDVRDGLGKEMEDVLERMYDHPTMKERVAIIEEFFLQRLGGKEYHANVVDGAILEIMRRQGNVQVQEIADKFKVSRQYLNLLFLPTVGLNVKEYARTVRFNCTLRAISNNKYADLGKAAKDSGYRDESHLIKDFHHFTGGRPSDFLSKENQLAKFLMCG